MPGVAHLGPDHDRSQVAHILEVQCVRPFRPMTQIFTRAWSEVFPQRQSVLEAAAVLEQERYGGAVDRSALAVGDDERNGPRRRGPGRRSWPVPRRARVARVA